MRTFTSTMLAAVALVFTGCVGHVPDSSFARVDNPSNDRALIFTDEFNSSTLDRSKWNVVGQEFWVNNEQQAYVDDPRVVSFDSDIAGADGGALVLRPIFSPGEDTRADRDAPFVSGRINSKGKFDLQYGRAEARIRMPDAVGVWPAFWMLGYDEWPATGEIDIMEYVGEKDWYGVAVHGPGYAGDAGLDGRYFFDADTDATDWHVYAVEWTEDSMIFEIDGRPMYRVTKPMTEFFGTWEFDNPKFLILNFAMGGAYPFKTNGIEAPYNGIPAETVEMVRRGTDDAGNGMAMYVDWVRVYAPEG